MMPAGYMFKHIAARPDWLKVDSVTDIWSVSNCTSMSFTNYIKFWTHNGHWMFDSPEKMEVIAKREGIDLSGATLCYYEVHEYEFDEDRKSWSPIEPERSFTTEVVRPRRSTLVGYDVVTFSVHTAPECSPLSCNYVAAQLPVNSHCLLGTFDEAKAALEAGLFDNSEPGPFRIFAVYTVERMADGDRRQ
ncbi:MAG TPA: hypothetical protein VG742_04500 [Dongiaceae bacterium]|nr:hypothetical protein [Dongiaceae bacterium]